MAHPRTALLIATDVHADPAFAQLNAPGQDVTVLARVLGDVDVGDYRVVPLVNEPSHQVRMSIDDLFMNAGRDDMLLLYFSGHGIKDETGRLYLATTDTKRNRLASTAIAAQFVRDCIDRSRARKVVVWLDCCYAGAFPAGTIPKAEGVVDVVDQLTDHSGRGCEVMTASTHIQYAFEQSATVQHDGTVKPSVFTSAIVQGLRTGDADLNVDGKISSSELYEYVLDCVKRSTPSQTPTRKGAVSGELIIAHSVRRLALSPKLPDDIRRNLYSRRPEFQRIAIGELSKMARTGSGVAKSSLRKLRDSGDDVLAPMAKEALLHLSSSPVSSRSAPSKTDLQPAVHIENEQSSRPRENPRPSGRDLLCGIGIAMACMTLCIPIAIVTVPSEYAGARTSSVMGAIFFSIILGVSWLSRSDE